MAGGGIGRATPDSSGYFAGPSHIERCGLPAPPAGGPRNVVYTRLQRLLRDECPEPGSALRALARISAFNLYISTTFDPLLENALNVQRYGGNSMTQRLAFFPEAALKDLPARKSDLSRATVFHLLGYVSPSPEYVVWEEDALEFVCALHQHLPVMEKLARDLKEHGLLVIGLNFSDWLVRFFLRITKQSRLSEARANTEVLTVGPPAGLSEGMGRFFGGVSRNIHVIECDPSAFVLELERRWLERHPAVEGVRGEFVAPPEDKMPTSAIFMITPAKTKTRRADLKEDGTIRMCCVVRPRTTEARRQLA